MGGGFQCKGEGRRAFDVLKTKASFHPLPNARLCARSTGNFNIKRLVITEVQIESREHTELGALPHFRGWGRLPRAVSKPRLEE